MPDIIRLLPDSVANQIAAGEVIQRPASVVKELMENAIDAGASVISVNLKDAGRTLIQIIDNGCGMSVTDARMAFERHSTSKISKAEDLFAIKTMGFRGEALASVAAVSEVNLKTRRVEDEVGTMVNISGSVVQKQEPVACAAGCNFSVRNLFFNVPVRRKFLKSNSTELKHILNEFIRIAVAWPSLEFNIIHNDTDIYNLPPTNLKQRIISLFGKGINQNLIPLKTETSIINISGFAGKPETSRKTFGEQFFFVNQRYMRSPYLHRAIMEAYEKVIPPGAVPSYFLFFDARPEFIDINIHPTKTEIKFEDERSVFQILLASLKEALGKYNMVPSLDFDSEGVIDIPVFNRNRDINIPQIDLNRDYNPFSETASAAGTERSSFHRTVVQGWEKLYEDIHETGKNASDKSQQELDTSTRIHTVKYLQLKNRYIIAPIKSGMMLIDQKRAHILILYENYLNSLVHQQALAQQDLFPQSIELNAADHSILLEMIDDLAQIGFDIRDLGNRTVVINGYPDIAEKTDPKEMIEIFLEEYKEYQKDVKADAREKLALSVAVASSIPYGKTLTDVEMRDLVDNLFACSNPGFTPDGKPVFTIFTAEEIDRKFRSV